MRRALDAVAEFAANPPDSRSTTARRQLRLLDHGDATDNDPESIAFAHTVFCQNDRRGYNPEKAASFFAIY